MQEHALTHDRLFKIKWNIQYIHIILWTINTTQILNYVTLHLILRKSTNVYIQKWDIYHILEFNGGSTFFYKSTLCHGHCHLWSSDICINNKNKNICLTTTTSTMFSDAAFVYYLSHIKRIYFTSLTATTTTWESFGLSPISSSCGLPPIVC